MAVTIGLMTAGVVGATSLAQIVVIPESEFQPNEPKAFSLIGFALLTLFGVAVASGVAVIVRSRLAEAARDRNEKRSVPSALIVIAICGALLAIIGTAVPWMTIHVPQRPIETFAATGLAGRIFGVSMLFLSCCVLACMLGVDRGLKVRTLLFMSAIASGAIVVMALVVLANPSLHKHGFVDATEGSVLSLGPGLWLMAFGAGLGLIGSIGGLARVSRIGRPVDTSAP